METRIANSWEEYVEHIGDIERQYGEYSSGSFTGHPEILYRGQGDSEWKLKTTLERYSDRKWTLTEYAELVYRCSPQIESLTGTDWKLPDTAKYFEEIDSAFCDYEARIPFYNYCAYLRHHGFPSPLLDWTRSPFVAAFFALEGRVSDQGASVFVFIERPTGGKMVGGSKNEVHSLGPYVSTHKRHFLQQCQYTIATEPRPGDRNRLIIPHHEVVDLGTSEQDVFIKITIPKGVRMDALKSLYAHNITHFSLFHSDEALMQSMAFQEIELKT